MMVKINLAVTLLLKLCNSGLSGVSNSPCNSTRMLNINEGVALVISKQKTLWLQSVPQALNARVRPTFL